ncbi:MAG: sigma 54-interacting transcriptional regulator [Myxococcota bacterium]|nr:sigma 54-interacting transcriptional regulator [Myxococcota bacterium]
MKRKSRDAETVSRITPPDPEAPRAPDAAPGHDLAEGPPVEAARRLDGVRGSEPFGAVIDELLELHRQAARATRFVFLDGPEGVGIPRIAERLAERLDAPLVQGALDGRAYGGLTHVIPTLLARARRFPARRFASERAFECAGGCCPLWFEHQDRDAALPAWTDLAARRAGFFEGTVELLAELGAREPATIWLHGLERLDAQTTALLEYVLDDGRLGGHGGSLWIAPLPPADRRGVFVDRLLEHPCSTRLTVAPMDYEEMRAYLAQPDVIRALLGRTGGLLDRVDEIVMGAQSRASGVVRTLRRVAEAAPAEVPAEAAVSTASDLAHRHDLDGAAAVLEAAAGETAAPPAELLESLVDLHATRGDLTQALEIAEGLLDAAPDDAAALTRVGRLARSAGRLERAEETLAHAVESSDTASRARALSELALVHLERAEYRLARERALASMALDPSGESALESRNTIGRAAWSAGDLEAAEASFAENEAVAEGRGDVRFRMRSLNNMALIRMSQGRLDDARGLLHRVVQLAAGQGAALHRAIALENIGVVDRLEGRFAEAIASYRAAARVLKAYEDQGLLVRVTTNLAEAHATLGCTRRAQEILALTASWRADGDRPERRADRLAIEADVAEQIGDIATAQRLSEEVLALARAAGYRRTEVLVTLRLARYRIAKGDTPGATAMLNGLEPDGSRNASRLALLRSCLEPDTEQAIRRARHALRLARDGGDPLLELRALVRLTSCLLASGARLEAEKRVTEAQTLIRRLELATPPDLREGFRTLEPVLDVQRLMERTTATPEEEAPKAEPRHLERLIGSSRAIEDVRAWVQRVGPSATTVLLTGESGTGKELVASALHDLSRRRGQPFVSVNCGAIVDTLLLSELFGHEQGAFTGATRRKRGRFELADGGTLFLDEVGEMSPSTQSALLRVLQERAFERVGGTETITVDVRVVAATNRDLESMVEEGRFRADLYYRLRALHLHLPPLRHRPGDVPEIARALLRREHGDSVVLAPEATELLEQHDWPGNVRELQNVLRAVTVLAQSSVLGRRELERHAPVLVGRPPGPKTGDLSDLYYDALQRRGSIYEIRKDLERAAVERALQETNGNISRAAALLGMKRPRLSQLASEYGLKKNGRES